MGQFDIGEVADAIDGLVDDLVHRAGPVVERRCRGHDDRTRLGQLGEHAQMPDVQRCFAHQQHQAAAFLERDIGGPDSRLSV